MSLVAPETVEELSDTLAQASAAGHTVRIQGGETRSGRGRPFEADRVLSTTNLSGVIDYEPADMTVTVHAGSGVEALEQELSVGQQAWPHADIQAGSTVGGILATGASGLSRLRYGPVRDSLLEIVIVTGDGRRVTAGARTVKSVAGYDLPRLMVGADGTLGVIAQATLRLWPKPAAVGWFRIEGSLDELAERVERWVRDPGRPLGVVLTPGALWVHAAGDEPAASLGEARPEGPPRPDGPGIVQIGVPPPGLLDALTPLEADGRNYRAQAGVGVIDVAIANPDDVAALRALSASLGGHAVITDGPPELRADPFGPPPPGVEIMRRLRNEFDPAGVLNPGLVPWEPADE